MAVMIYNYKKTEDDLVFIRRDTLTERLRRMRALNSTPTNIGITQYRWKSGIGTNSFLRKEK